MDASGVRGRNGAPRGGWLAPRLVLFLKGVSMGAADLVPGVSGGTVALIVGVYARLVDSLRAVASGKVFRILSPGGFRAYWNAIDGGFLLVLGLGILTAVVALSRVITGLLGAYPVLVWAFFGGIVLSSLVGVGRGIPRWRGYHVALSLLGGALGALIALAPVGSFPEGPVTDAVCGAIAICAMILPGISGSFVLLLLGRYASILQALHGLQWSVILPFAGGALVGLLSFSRLLSWLLRRYPHGMLALLLGLMGGASPRLWPWQRLGEAGTIDLLTPAEYAMRVGSPWVWAAILAAIAGALLVALLDRMARRR